MLISYSHHFLFIHVPKTGGLSVAEALRSYAHSSDGYWMNRLLERIGIHVNHYAPYRHKRFRTHTAAVEFQRELPAAVFRDLFKFAFVRNPWDLMVSYYHYLVTNPHHHAHQRTKRLGGFDRWLEFELRRDKRLQSRLLSDRQGRLLVDFVGRYETLAEDFAHVCRQVGVSASLPHINRTAHRDYRMYYSDAEIELVAQAFQADIETFGYAFDGGGQNAARQKAGARAA
jgi:hypothetical protein